MKSLGSENIDNDLISYLPRMSNLLRDEFNKQIMKHEKTNEIQLWLIIAERIFEMLYNGIDQTKANR